jgi:hypothetical protein
MVTDRSVEVARTLDGIQRISVVEDVLGVDSLNPSLPRPFVRMAASQLLKLEAGQLEINAVKRSLLDVDLTADFYITNPVELTES